MFDTVSVETKIVLPLITNKIQDKTTSPQQTSHSNTRNESLMFWINMASISSVVHHLIQAADKQYALKNIPASPFELEKAVFD